MKKSLLVLSASMLYLACASESTSTGSDVAAATKVDGATAPTDTTTGSDATVPTDPGGPPVKLDGQGGPDLGVPPDGMPGGGPDGMPGGGPDGNGPAKCETNAECTPDVCKSTLGCSCFSTPDGKLCVPHCKVDADCPTGPNVKLKCAQDGFCKPEGAGDPGGSCTSDTDCKLNCPSPSGCKCMNSSCAPKDAGDTTCVADAECTGACPPGSKGCACQTPPGTCVPTCTQAADCPSKVGTPVECKDGKCAQGGGGPP